MARRPADEQKITGLNAVLALAHERREDVVRLYLTEARLPELRELLRWCAAERRAYHVVDAAELERVAGGVHHEGVCALAKARRQPRPGELLRLLSERTGDVLLLLLEDVKNPHNVGAIVRTAAHFGALAVLLAGEAPAPEGSAALWRTAEGGAEYVDLVPVEPGRFLPALRERGFEIVATSGRGEESLYGRPLAARTVLLLGAEGHGLSPRLLAAADRAVQIPGTGWVESLNVASAAAVLAAEYQRNRLGAAGGGRRATRR